VIVSSIGIENFGIFVVVSALSANISFLDLGVGDTFGRFISAAAVNNDVVAIRELVNAGFFFYATLSLAVIVILYPLAGSVLNFFNISPALRSDALFVYYLGLLSFSIGYVFNVFVGVPYGLQRMDMINIVSIARTAGAFLLSVAVLKLGFGLRGLLVVNLIVAAAVAVANLLVAKSFVPDLRISPRFFRLSVLKQMMGVGVQLQAVRITRAIYDSLNNLIVARFLSVNTAAYYNIGNRLALYAQSLPKLMDSATIPLAAGFAAKGEEEKNYMLYAKITGYTGMLVFPMIAGLWLAADLLVTAWMGPGFEPSALALRVLAPGILFYATCSPAASVMLSNRHISKVTALSVVGAVVTLSSSVVLTKFFGLTGACLAISISLWLISLAYHVLFGTLYRRCFPRYFLEYWARPLLATIVVTTVVKLSLPGLLSAVDGRLANILQSGKLAITFGVAYLALLWLFRCIQEEDLKIILAGKPGLLAFAYRMKLI